MDMFPEKEIEPSEPGDEAAETLPAETPEEVPAPVAAAEEAAAEPRRASFDEAFAEMRQSLREEETKEQTGFGSGVKRFVQKIFRRKTAPLPEVTEARLDEFAIPETPRPAKTQPPAVTTPEGPAASEALQEAPGALQQQEEQRPPSESGTFEKLVRNKMTGAMPGLDKIEPLVARPHSASEDDALDFLAPGQTGLKQEQDVTPPTQSILQSIRGEEQQEQEVSSIRQAALEDYEVAPAEAEEEQAAPLPRRLRRGWRDMRPVDRTLLTGVLGLLAVVIVGTGAYAAAKKWIPTPTPVPMTPTTSIVPIPLSLTLPGVPAFALKTGAVDQNGVWNPTGPEWLRGTEVCRWVSLPWNVQREAVLRTLKADDPIQLTMSDYSSIIYKVKSIDQVSTGEIKQLANDTPCLLVILSNQDTPTRWVVTAKP